MNKYLKGYESVYAQVSRQASAQVDARVRVEFDRHTIDQDFLMYDEMYKLKRAEKENKYQLEESALRFGQGLVIAVCLSIVIVVLSVALFGALMESLRTIP